LYLSIIECISIVKQLKYDTLARSLFYSRVCCYFMLSALCYMLNAFQRPLVFLVNLSRLFTSDSKMSTSLPRSHFLRNFGWAASTSRRLSFSSFSLFVRFLRILGVIYERDNRASRTGAFVEIGTRERQPRSLAL